MKPTGMLTIVTHDGQFHSDDVLAVAILTTIYRNHEIVRSRDPDVIAQGDFVVDVGGVYDNERRLYDHHMHNPPTDSHNHMLSSAGLIWQHYSRNYLQAIKIPKTFRDGDRLVELAAPVARIMKTDWIVPIDRADNGTRISLTPISELVKAMVPIDCEKSPERYNELFEECVVMVRKLFERACFHAVDMVFNRHAYLIAERTYHADGRIVVVDASVREFGAFMQSDVHFVVYPTYDATAGCTYYLIRPIFETDKKSHKAGERKQYKTPFPRHLWGVPREELGWDGIMFIHHNGFMARALSKDHAVAFCESLLINQ